MKTQAILLVLLVVALVGSAAANKAYPGATANDGTDVWVDVNEITAINPDTTSTDNYVRTTGITIINPDAECTITLVNEKGESAGFTLLAGQSEYFKGWFEGFVIDKTTTQVVSYLIHFD